MEKSETIAWFQGRSEFGQRALGGRSILGDPRSNGVRLHINQKVKQREWFRPLAPAVLAEHANDWFDLSHVASSDATESDPNVSPYMSITAQVREEKVAQVPAICHIDNSARLQTVTASDNPLFHALITAFFRRTGRPMVLNTSFNRNNEPIVETPQDAIISFLASHGHIEKLYIGSFEVSYKKFDSNMLNDSSATLVFAQPIYLSEVVTSPHSTEDGSTGKPVRIRIQTAGAGSEVVTDDDDGDSAAGNWIVLPDQIHLEIMQLLQVPPPTAAEDGGGSGEDDQQQQEQPGVSVNGRYYI